MKTEDLQAKGLTQEQINYVMAEYGKEINPLIAERDGYKTQLGTAQAALKAMEGVDAGALQTQVADLTQKLSGKNAEIQQIKADFQFNELLKDAIRGAGARNEKAVMPFLDVDGLKKSSNQTQDIQAALEAIKKDNDYLFQSAQTTPKFVSSTPGISQNTDDKKTQANEALRSILGRE